MEDLAHDGERLRQAIPPLLEQMAEEGILQQDGDEYRLQTAAGRIWDEAFRRHSAQLTDSEITTERDKLLREDVEKTLPASVVQGRAKVARKIAFHSDPSQPQITDLLPVWLRSEWDDGITARQFEDQARGLGSDSPIVLVHLPRVQATSFAAALRNRMAAQRVLDQQGFPQDDEGKQARRSMESRLDRAQAQVRDHVRDILGKASVMLGGGAVPTGVSLRERVENGAQSAAVRLFSKFDIADDPRWPQVIDRIRKGSGTDALKAVGYDGTPEQQAVVKEVLGRIGAAGTPATEVEKALQSAPFGWPREALMASIGVLIDTGLIRATVNGSDASTSQVLSQTRLGTVHLRRESTVLKTSEKIAARSLLNKLGVPADNDTLIAAAAQAVTQLSQRATAVSGPAPLPDIACPPSIEAVLTTSGNDRVHSLLAAKDEITEFSECLETMEHRRALRLATLATARSLADAARGWEAPLSRVPGSLPSRAPANCWRILIRSVRSWAISQPLFGTRSAALLNPSKSPAGGLWKGYSSSRHGQPSTWRSRSNCSPTTTLHRKARLHSAILPPCWRPSRGGPSRLGKTLWTQCRPGRPRRLRQRCG